jgi:DNA polymerase-1
MIPRTFDAFDRLVVLDTEFVPRPGNAPLLCALGYQIVGQEQVHTYRQDEILQWTTLPFPVDKGTLLIAYNVPAEAAFLHTLGLEQPRYWADPMVEDHRARTVCIPRKALRQFSKRHPEIFRPNSPCTLLQCLEQWGITDGDAQGKEVARDIILSRKWEQDARLWPQILAYQASDVRLLTALFLKMEGSLDPRSAIIRGSYAAAQGRMSQRGIPVDQGTYRRLLREYPRVLQGVRSLTDPEHVRLTTKGKISIKWLRPKLEAIGAARTHVVTATGRPSAKASRLRETAERYADAELLRVAEWAELLSVFLEKKEGGLRAPSLGDDGRVRYDQLPFGTHTGRTQGWGRDCLMAQPKWMRGLVCPASGEALISADFSGEEFGIAAAKSGDQRMQEAYKSGDPYSYMATMAGMLPAATAEETRKIRSLFKVLTLGKLYGLGLRAFGAKSGLSYRETVRVWQFFERSFARFLWWQGQVVAQARRRGWIQTQQRWYARVVVATKTTSLLNWLIQASGGDVLRTSVLMLADAGLDLLTTVHDSVLVSVPAHRVEEEAQRVHAIMQEASQIVLGMPIRVDIQIVRPGERLLTAETQRMWDRVSGLLEQG